MALQRTRRVAVLWVPLTIGLGLLGFLVSLWALWNVQLVKAGPLTFGVTVIAAAATAVYSVLLSVPVAFLSGIAVMIWCRYHPGWALRNNVQESRPMSAA